MSRLYPYPIPSSPSVDPSIHHYHHHRLSLIHSPSRLVSSCLLRIILVCCLPVCPFVSPSSLRSHTLGTHHPLSFFPLVSLALIDRSVSARLTHFPPVAPPSLSSVHMGIDCPSIVTTGPSLCLPASLHFLLLSLSLSVRLSLSVSESAGRFLLFSLHIPYHFVLSGLELFGWQFSLTLCGMRLHIYIRSYILPYLSIHMVSHIMLHIYTCLSMMS